VNRALEYRSHFECAERRGTQIVTAREERFTPTKWKHSPSRSTHRSTSAVVDPTRFVNVTLCAVTALASPVMVKT
jgi:hypothetical protein